MDKEIDKELCEKYPKIFRDRHAPMTQTCMCWGFEIGGGWYNILDNACNLIQGHINSSRRHRVRALRFNRALKRALEKDDLLGLIKYFSIGGDEKVIDRAHKYAKEEVERGKYWVVPEVCSQVVATQVKEKFGGLRFYYCGGDDFVHGVISMAEHMSYTTCEVCGNLGESNGGGWIEVRCEKCGDK